MNLLAHGIGGIRDLPVPAWLFLWGGSVVLVISFLALGVLWRQPQLERRAGGRSLTAWLQRVLGSAVLRFLVGAVSAGLLVLVFLAALIGEPSSAENLAPTFVYVIFWLGLVVVQVVLGNVWPVLNPWLAVANAVNWISERLGQRWEPPLSYPARLGVYPAALALFAFTALELCYPDPANPRALALAIAIYSYSAWFGMAAYGRRAWSEGGDGFTAYFGLLARIAPFARRDDGRFVVRIPFTGLAGADRRPGVLALVAVMLGSVGFDGLSRASFWQDLRARVEGPYVLDSPGTADLVSTLLGLAGLLGCIALVAVAYLTAVRISRALADAERSLVPDFLLESRPDRARLRGRALLHAPDRVREGRRAAAGRPVRVRLEPARRRGLRSPVSRRRSRRTRSGTSRWRRSSPGTPSGWRWPTTGRSASCPRAARSDLSTRCSR